MNIRTATSAEPSFVMPKGRRSAIFAWVTSAVPHIEMLFHRSLESLARYLIWRAVRQMRSIDAQRLSELAIDAQQFRIWCTGGFVSNTQQKTRAWTDVQPGGPDA